MHTTLRYLAAMAACTPFATSASAQSAKDIRDKGALDVSPRIGHIHVTVDDAPWHFVDASGETLILVGLEPGPRSN